MTAPLPTSSDPRLVTGPLSVHGLPEPELRRRFRRRMNMQLIASVVILLPLSATIGFVLYTGSDSLALACGVAVVTFALLFGANAHGLSRSYASALQLAESWTLELWPDTLVLRIPGELAHEIARTDLVSLKLTGSSYGKLYIGHREASRSLVIPAGLTNFDRLYETLLQWCPPEGCGKRILGYAWVRLGVYVLGVLAYFLALVAPGPLLSTFAAAVAVAAILWSRKADLRVSLAATFGRRPHWAHTVLAAAVPCIACFVKWSLYLGGLR